MESSLFDEVYSILFKHRCLVSRAPIYFASNIIIWLLLNTNAAISSEVSG